MAEQWSTETPLLGAQSNEGQSVVLNPSSADQLAWIRLNRLPLGPSPASLLVFTKWLPSDNYLLVRCQNPSKQQTVSSFLRPVSWRPSTVKWWQFSQSNRHSTTRTRQTEYHEVLPCYPFYFRDSIYNQSGANPPPPPPFSIPSSSHPDAPLPLPLSLSLKVTWDHFVRCEIYWRHVVLTTTWTEKTVRSKVTCTTHLRRVHLSIDGVFSSSVVFSSPVQMELRQLVYLVAKGTTGQGWKISQGHHAAWIGNGRFAKRKTWLGPF